MLFIIELGYIQLCQRLLIDSICKKFRIRVEGQALGFKRLITTTREFGQPSVSDVRPAAGCLSEFHTFLLLTLQNPTGQNSEIYTC